MNEIKNIFDYQNTKLRTEILGQMFQGYVIKSIVVFSIALRKIPHFFEVVFIKDPKSVDN